MLETQKDRKMVLKEIIGSLFKKGIMPDRQILSRLEHADLSIIMDGVEREGFGKEDLKALLDSACGPTAFEENGPVSSKEQSAQMEESEDLADSKNSVQKHSTDVFSSVKILNTYNDAMKKKTVQSFVKYFNARYKTIRSMLQQRTELSSVQAIRRILEKKERETVSTIGLIFDKRETKNGNLVLEIEDQTGNINIIVSKEKKEVYEFAKNTVLDEVIGVTGMSGEKAIFANSIIIPDAPVGREFKKAEDEAYAVVLSDLHVGSTLFLEQDFRKLVAWLGGSVGNERQKEIAKKVRYVLIAGDLVDGIGIYPSQQKELNIDDIYGQYEKCAELLRGIPSHLPIIIIPGNHDAMRLTEPQPTLYKDYAKSLWELPNVMMLTNPALINIHANQNFPGFDILLYHGYSFDYYADNVESIRQKRPNISDRADLVQKFLIQRRHLSPSHSATLYVQDEEKDPLIIDRVPDFFISGHIHKAAVSNYRNVTMISGSCFQAKTPFQEKVGHEPEPSRIPIINLQTRETRILNFASEKDEQEEKESEEKK